MEKVRQKGPFDVFGTPLVLQPMPSDFDPDMEPEVKVPVWLRLVDLPLDLWNLSAVSKIASFIGTPLTTDFKTLRRESMDGPRIQVIVNTAQRPKEAISVQLPSGNFLEVKIEYVELTQEEFQAKMDDYMDKLTELFAEGNTLQTEILEQLKKVKYEANYDK